VDELIKTLASGLPWWGQIALIVVGFGIQYYFMRYKQKVETAKANESLKQKSLLLHNATETFFNERYHIKKSIFIDQKDIASRILQQFINNLATKYEQELQSMEIETRDSELLILAFDGFLSKIKEEIMENVERFITSKDFESDNYMETQNGITNVSNQISLHLNNIFKKQYSSKRYKVVFPDNLPKTPVVDMITDIYKQAKSVYDTGESKIENLKRTYEETTQSIIGGRL
jgi:hypothetical protein